jgi:hypothetical protein
LFRRLLLRAYRAGRGATLPANIVVFIAETASVPTKAYEIFATYTNKIRVPLVPQKAERNAKSDAKTSSNVK